MSDTSTPSTTIPAMIDACVARFGDDEGLVDGDIRWTFAELRGQIHTAAKALIAGGIHKGDRVAIWAPNIAEFVVAALGIHCAGAILVPINTRFKGREAGYTLDKSGADLLFTVSDFLDNDYVALLDEAEVTVATTVVLRGDVRDGCVGFNDFLSAADSVDDDALADRMASVRGEDLCHIMFTSGTTGLPKGARLRHDATCRGYNDWADIVGLRAGDRYLIVNPFFHSFGMNAGILACLMKGATIVPQALFDVPAVMKQVPAERISVLPGPPAIYQTILNHPDLADFDMSTLRLAVTGAAPVPVPMIHAMRQKLGFENIITAYGLTETHGLVSACRADDSPETISTTSGRAMPDIEVLIVDANGQEVQRGQPGEIVVKGYLVMDGYFEDPDNTAEAIDADGWLHTGDIGVMDADGYIDITDRLKDMFIVGGFNAYPAEIENLLSSHPDIAQVAVIGIPDERMGEVGMAFVVAADGTTPEPDAIIAWAREEMANYKVPRRVQIIDELPLNASNKVLKTELRTLAT